MVEGSKRPLDFEKTRMQEDGSFSAIGLTLAEIVEVVTDIGLHLDEVEIAHGIVVVKARAFERSA